MATAPPPVLADNLQRLLGVHKLTIGEAADVLALSRQSVSELLRGRRSPAWSTIARISATFEIDSDDLMTRPFEEWAGAYFADRNRIRRVIALIHNPDHKPDNPVKGERSPDRLKPVVALTKIDGPVEPVNDQVEGFTRGKKA